MIDYNLLQTPQPQGKAQQIQPMPASQSPNPSLGGLDTLLTGLGAVFGSNPVKQANAALTDSIANTPPDKVANALLPQSSNLPPSNSPIQQAISSPTGALNQAMTPQSLQPMIAQAFPNDPIRQQLALSQATEESNLLGNPSQLASKFNNLLGMKGQGTAGTAALPTQENINGKNVTQNAGFAAYKSPQDSIDAYAKLMRTDRYKGVLNASNLNDAAMAAQKAGYATDPNYAEKVTRAYDKIQTTFQAHTTPTAYLEKGQPVSSQMANSPSYQSAIQSYAHAAKAGLTKSPYFVNVDFSQPATAKRLSVVNAKTGQVVLSSEVAQGAPGFSNTPNSHQSSLGTFLTDQTYDGKHGYSMRIRGLDKGVNDNVMSRDVVVHGASYIGNGKTGHSFGCFAVPQDVAPKLINLIKGGTVIHAYAGQQSSENDTSKYYDPNQIQKPLIPSEQQQDVTKQLDQGHDDYE